MRRETCSRWAVAARSARDCRRPRNGSSGHGEPVSESVTIRTYRCCASTPEPVAFVSATRRRHGSIAGPGAGFEGGDSLRAALLSCIAVHQGAAAAGDDPPRSVSGQGRSVCAPAHSRRVTRAVHWCTPDRELERRRRGEAKGAWIEGIRAYTLEPETLHPGEEVGVGEPTAEAISDVGVARRRWRDALDLGGGRRNRISCPCIRHRAGDRAGR